MPRPARNNNSRLIDITNDILPKGIQFNYSENFNNVCELTLENFQYWRTNILYLLTINNLEEYISSPVVKKLKRRDITDNIENYIIDNFDGSLVYAPNTTKEDIKWIITNSLGEKTKALLKSHNKTAYQMWQFLQESFTLGVEHKKMILKQKLNLLSSTWRMTFIFLSQTSKT